MHIRLGKMKQMLAVGLAMSAMAQTFLALPVTAAEEVEVVEAAEIIEVPETVEPVELAPAEDIVTSKEAWKTMIESDKFLWIQPGIPHDEAGVHWDGTTLTLTNYKGGKAIGILRGNTPFIGNEINVIVNGDNTLEALYVGNLDPAAPQFNITGRNQNTDILRFRRDEENASIISNYRGSINISNVTINIQSLSTEGRCSGIKIDHPDGQAITVKNSTLDIRMNSGHYSMGIGTEGGNSPVTLENTVYHFKAPDQDKNGGTYPIHCSHADLTIKNTQINLTGKAVYGIHAETLKADRLTLNADLLSKEKPGYTSALRGTTAVINDSVINVTAQEAVSFDDVSMTNTTAEVTTYSYRNEYGRRDDGFGFEAISGSIFMQGCDVKVNVTDADSGGELIFESSGFKSKSMTFSDSRIRIKINSVHPDDTGINSLDGTLVCKGNTTIQVESSQIAYMCNDGGGIDLRDGLAILTPAGGSVKPMPNAQNVNVILDARGNIAGNLVIGKGGSSSGSGNAPGGGTGTGTGTSTGTSGSGGTASSGIGGGSSSGSTSAAGTGTWKKAKNGKYWYDLGKGKYPKSKWLQIGGKWYYFDKSGYMVTGWKKINRKWYYFGGKKDGAMKTGWVKSSGKWYYMDKKSGAMQTGWLKSGGKWYYLNGKGVMLANTSRKIGRKTYRFDKNGVCTNA